MIDWFIIDAKNSLDVVLSGTFSKVLVYGTVFLFLGIFFCTVMMGNFCYIFLFNLIIPTDDYGIHIHCKATKYNFLITKVLIKVIYYCGEPSVEDKEIPLN